MMGRTPISHLLPVPRDEKAEEARVGDSQYDKPLATAASNEADLLVALKEARDLIELWHGMHSTHAAMEWRLYQHSPEMQRLNAVIAKAEGR